MAFFKKYNGTVDVRLRRLESMAWLCIYAGLLVAMLGYFIQHTQGGNATGYFAAGASVVALGVVQIYLRSRLHEHD